MLKRGKRALLGEISGIQAVEIDLDTLSRDDPFSPDFNPRVGNTPRDLTTYLIAVQQSAYGRSVLIYMSYWAVQRNMKLLLKVYSPLQIKRAIRLSVRAKYPCTTKYLKYLIRKHFDDKSVHS